MQRCQNISNIFSHSCKKNRADLLEVERLVRSLPSNVKMILKADYVDERVVWVVGERRELKRLPVTHFLEMHKHGNWRWG